MSTDIIMFLSVLSTTVVFCEVIWFDFANKETTVFNREEVVTNLCAVYGERMAKQIIMHE